jgi:hypothetical protein
MPASPSDPLLEAPNAVWYVRPAAGGQYGPATAEIMRGWLGEGRVGADTLVWREGWRDWQEASAIFPQFKPDDMNVFLGGGGTQGAKTATSPSSSPAPPRRTSNASTATLIAVLVVAVIVLFVVFLMVLFQQSPAEPERKPTSPPAKATSWSPPLVRNLTRT